MARQAPHAALLGPARPAVRVRVALVVFSLLTIGLLYVLYTYAIPLGEGGKFVYRYSQMLPIRLARCGAGLPALGLFAWAARWLARPNGEWRGVAIGSAGMVWLVAWTWWMPPGYLQQHAMNLLSPSHEGAFLIESREVRSASDYLRRFDAERLPKSVEEMRGTRVLSNTPGTTILAYWMTTEWPSDVNNPGVFERYLLSVDTRPEDVPAVAYGMKFSVVLTALWGLSSAFAYLMGRQFLSPLGAGLVAVMVTYNPATANFVPGKDPAQLLTINAMLWAWFVGVNRKSSTWTATAGAILMIGMAWGLVHLWVAATAWVATVGYSMRRWESWGAMGARFVLSPMAGAAAMLLAVYLMTGWDMAHTFAAVGNRYEEVQHWITYDRGLWFVIGLPLFLLFVSPALYAMVALSRGRWRWRRWTTKWYLLGATTGVMGVSYFVGITYELPRLWVAFVPLLTLGAATELPALRARDGRRVVRLIVLLVVANCVATAMHVAALDARESEYRLSRPTLFN